MINFDDKDLAIVGLVVIGIVSLIVLGKNGVDVVRDVIVAIGSMTVGSKLLSKNRNA